MHNDPEARWLLLLMTHDSNPVIREPARRAAAAAGLSQQEIARAEPAARLEQDGILAIENRKYDLAYSFYRESLEKGVWFNGALRLRLARYLHLEGHADQARVELQKIIDGPKATSHDREVAARRLKMLASPPRLYSPEDLKLEVELLELPAWLPNGRSSQARLRVKNTGTTAWQGGFWQFRIGFVIRWEDSDGNLLPQRKMPRAYLPDAGVLPGESVDLIVLAYPPNARDLKVRPVLEFFQDWLTLPNDGIVYRAEQLIQVGTDKTKKKPSKAAKKKPANPLQKGRRVAPRIR